jgi:hypothetical protein
MLYMFHKGDVPSIQCKMSLRAPKNMRKVDDMSLIFIDCCVLVFTPRLSSAETSLQLYENVTVVTVCHMLVYTGFINTGLDGYHVLGRMICMYILSNIGGRMEPCGTSACMSLGVDISPSTESLNFL